MRHLPCREARGRPEACQEPDPHCHEGKRRDASAPSTWLRADSAGVADGPLRAAGHWPWAGTETAVGGLLCAKAKAMAMAMAKVRANAKAGGRARSHPIAVECRPIGVESRS
jgi:hypothetical protein